MKNTYVAISSCCHALDYIVVVLLIQPKNVKTSLKDKILELQPSIGLDKVGIYNHLYFSFLSARVLIDLNPSFFFIVLLQ